MPKQPNQPLKTKRPAKANGSEDVYSVNKSLHEAWVKSYDHLFRSNEITLNWDLNSLPLLETYFIFKATGHLRSVNLYESVEARKSRMQQESETGKFQEDPHSLDCAKVITKLGDYSNIASPYTQEQFKKIIKDDVIPFIEYIIANEMMPIYLKSEFIDLMFVGIRRENYGPCLFRTCLTPTVSLNMITPPKISDVVISLGVVDSDAGGYIDIKKINERSTEQLERLKKSLINFTKSQYVKSEDIASSGAATLINASKNRHGNTSKARLPFTYNEILKFCRIKIITDDYHAYAINPQENVVHEKAEDIILSCVKDLIKNEDLKRDIISSITDYSDLRFKNRLKSLAEHLDAMHSPAEDALRSIFSAETFQGIDLRQFYEKSNFNENETALQLLILYYLEVKEKFLSKFMTEFIRDSIINKTVFRAESFYSFEISAVILLIKSQKCREAILEVKNCLEKLNDTNTKFPLIDFMESQLTCGVNGGAKLNYITFCWHVHDLTHQPSKASKIASQTKPELRMEDLNELRLIPKAEINITYSKARVKARPTANLEIASLEVFFKGNFYQANASFLYDSKSKKKLVKTKLHFYLHDCCIELMEGHDAKQSTSTISGICKKTKGSRERFRSIKEMLEEIFVVEEKMEISTKDRLNIKIELNSSKGWKDCLKYDFSKKQKETAPEDHNDNQHDRLVEGMEDQKRKKRESRRKPRKPRKADDIKRPQDDLPTSPPGI